jgi:spore coat polysaccharide biosynthesis protein SpsF
LIAGIVAARMESTRLPGKALFEICAKTIIQIMVERMKSSKKLDRIIIATSTNKKDDLIEKFCRENDIECYRGHEENLIARYKKISDLIGTDVIAKFGADSPLIDPKVIDEVIDIYLNNDYDYVSNYWPPPKTYPEGTGLDVYSAKTLTEAYNEAKKPSELEHINPFICNRPNSYKLHRVDYKKNISNYRFSLDYQEDFVVIKSIYEALYPKNSYFTLEDIIAWLHSNPEIFKINSHIHFDLDNFYKKDRR